MYQMISKIFGNFFKKKAPETPVKTRISPIRAYDIAQQKQNELLELALDEILEKVKEQSEKGEEYTFIFADHSKIYKGSMSKRIIEKLEEMGYWAQDSGSRPYAIVSPSDYGTLHIKWDQASRDAVQNKLFNSVVGSHTHTIVFHNNHQHHHNIVLGGGGPVGGLNMSLPKSINGTYEIADEPPKVDKEKLSQDISKKLNELL
jgi:hypothetical protein